jgi:ribosomal protein S18 acetylase RimI-like enzyme
VTLVAPELDLALVARLEAHALTAWPPTICERAADGWVMRATPGLDRGRSNHALTPVRELTAAEVASAADRAGEFARRHAIRAGIQVSPLELHGELVRTLAGRGWDAAWSVVVMTAAVPDLAAGPRLELHEDSEATPEWLAAWERCEPGRDVEAHVRTVFAGLRGRARFARAASGEAVGIAVEGDGLVGLFCLAVDPERRRRGLGSALVRGLAAGSGADLAYLQVEATNHPALALYDRLGFGAAYHYRHCVAPC